MDIKALAREIRDLDYVVMRNWEKMPPEGDIDFFVDIWHYDMLKAACEEHLGDARWFDIRTNGDGYLPPKIEHEMLYDKRFFLIGEGAGFWTPSAEAHFLSLYYHQLVHKGDRRYQDVIDKSFREWVQPVKPQDPGVGFHDSHQTA